MLVLSRQDLPVLDGASTGTASPAAPTCCATADDAQAVIVGTGSRGLTTAVAAADLLAADGIAARVVSMPSWELFAAAGRGLPRGGPAAPACRRSRVEAGISHGLGALGRRARCRSSASAPRAPGAEVLEKLGITPQATADAVRELLAAVQTA